MNGSRRSRAVRSAASAAIGSVVVFAPLHAMAQDPGVETVTQLAQFIRWGGVVTSLFVVAGAWLALKFMARAVDALGRRFVARRMTLNKLATFLQFMIYTGAATTALMLSFRLDARVLAVVGGTVAVSVGFAIKDLVASFVAGITIMLDRPFQVGDRVSFGGQYGDITAIGLRSVRMQTLDDNTVTIPNNKFLNDITSCGNYGALDMMVVMDFFIGLGEDVERARRLLLEAATTSRFVHLPKPVTVLVNQVFESSYMAVRLRLKAYVLDTKYEKALESDLNLRVLSAFREAAILPPAILHRSTPPTDAGPAAPAPTPDRPDEVRPPTGP